MDNKKTILILGDSRLAYRINILLKKTNYTIICFSKESITGEYFENVITPDILKNVCLIYILDEQDEINLGLILKMISLSKEIRIIASLFNENIIPHLQVAHANLTVLNPAKIAAPVFIETLDNPIEHSLSYKIPERSSRTMKNSSDKMLGWFIGMFSSIILFSIVYFHFAENLSWIDSIYFVFVTIATVGYGDISLAHSVFLSKIVGIGLIISSTFFIWIVFSLTIDRIIKKRSQLALGRKKYTYKNHIVLCGLGRLGYFIAEELIKKSEQVIIIEKKEDSPFVDYFKSQGIDVYIGNGRLEKVLGDVNIAQAKALIVATSDDFLNIEIGLTARSFNRDLKIILRIFDDSMAQHIKDNLDIHLTLSMSAIADEKFVDQLKKLP